MYIKRIPAKKMTIYLDDNTKYQGRAAYQAVLDLLMEKGVAGATLFKGAAGYGGDRKMHSASVLRLTEDLPLKIEVVDMEEKIEAVLKDIMEIVKKGMVILSDTEMVKRFEGEA